MNKPNLETFNSGLADVRYLMKSNNFFSDLAVLYPSQGLTNGN
jgi:hypothetical protein